MRLHALWQWVLHLVHEWPIGIYYYIVWQEDAVDLTCLVLKHPQGQFILLANQVLVMAQVPSQVEGKEHSCKEGHNDTGEVSLREVLVDWDLLLAAIVID